MPWTEQVFRGDDGNVWLFHQVTRAKKYALALAQLMPASAKPPVFVDTHDQIGELLAAVDATGLATVLDLRTNLLTQGTKRRKLVMPTPSGIYTRRGRNGAFRPRCTRE